MMIRGFGDLQKVFPTSLNAKSIAKNEQFFCKVVKGVAPYPTEA